MTEAVAVIPAAGIGARMNAGRNKLLLNLSGDNILSHTFRLFYNHPKIHRIVISINENEFSVVEYFLDLESRRDKPVELVKGGPTRQESVMNALKFLHQFPHPERRVLIHDGARPLCLMHIIDEVLNALNKHQAVIPVIPMTDTIRLNQGTKSEVLPRDLLVATQTPQGFHWEVIWLAHQQAMKTGLGATDDAALVEAMNIPVEQVTGHPSNIKITTPLDLKIAEWWLRQHRELFL